VRTRSLPALLILLALTLGATPGAAATPGPQPLELRVDGGEERWLSTPTFVLRWSNPPTPITAVHYRVLAATGSVAVTPRSLPWDATSLQVSVPWLPGVYTAELWLEGVNESLGTPASAKLRFDPVAPGQIEAVPTPAWIGRPAFPLTLQLGRPSGTPPLSGIAGYAATVSGASDGGSCLVSDTCANATELNGGIDEDGLAVTDLPEGTSYLHAVTISGSGKRSLVPSSTVLRVDKTDPLVQLQGTQSGWSNRPLTLTATASDAASGMTQLGGGGETFTAIRVDGATPTVTPGNEATTTLIESGVHAVAYYARDAAGNVADGSIHGGRSNPPPATTLVRIDRQPPLLAFAPAQDPREPERIEARVSDLLSGVDLSHGSIEVRRAGSNRPFTPLPTRYVGSLLRAHWDSEASPPGEYEFRATAHDLAGNVSSTQVRGGGGAMRLSSPLKVQAQLLTETGGRTLPYGRGVDFKGRAVVGRRAPLADVAVRVTERFDAGAVPAERVSVVRSDPSGAFAIRLPAGPSRQVVAAVAPTASLRGATTKPRRIAVRTRVRLRTSTRTAQVGGRPLLFQGRVESDGTTIPSDGKVVQLQFRLPGLPWREFRTVRSDPQGRFRYAYRFADDDSRGVRFQFRAFATAQAGWPFEPAGSASVAVRGL
jgi:hypothetical protein